jgi:hypothetical protein
MSSFMFWRSVQGAAEIEASVSPLPGFYDGPADAYRHIIGTAELRRRFGWATAYSIATGNEMLGTHFRSHPAYLRRMDDHNNAIGLAIGVEARSYEDVVRLARAAIDKAIVAGGSGQDGTPVWLPKGWSEPAHDVAEPVRYRSIGRLCLPRVRTASATSVSALLIRRGLVRLGNGKLLSWPASQKHLWRSGPRPTCALSSALHLIAIQICLGMPSGERGFTHTSHSVWSAIVLPAQFRVAKMNAPESLRYALIRAPGRQGRSRSRPTAAPFLAISQRRSLILQRLLQADGDSSEGTPGRVGFAASSTETSRIGTLGEKTAPSKTGIKHLR